MRVFTGNGGGGGVSLRMELERYEVRVNAADNVYIFWSQGPRGLIRKVVIYSRVKGNTYNLGFGDWDALRNCINDTTRSSNDDMDKVLVTVASTILDFIKRNPSATVDIEGSTPARTRLYQMRVVRNLTDIETMFKIKGWHNGKWRQFEAGINYKRLRLKAR